MVLSTKTHMTHALGGLIDTAGWSRGELRLTAYRASVTTTGETWGEALLRRLSCYRIRGYSGERLTFRLAGPVQVAGSRYVARIVVIHPED